MEDIKDQRPMQIEVNHRGGYGGLRRLSWGLALGQIASLLISFTGLTSSILSRQGVNLPTSQSFCNYFLLAFIYGTIFLYRKKPIQARWYYYLLVAFIDVEGNYFVVKAYQYTSLTSVMLLDCWTIPCVLLLTWLWLKTKYKMWQLFGACVCILGLGLVILSDVHADDRARGSNVALGDSLVIIGATLYALTNVSEEFLIKRVDFIEYMAFLGLFGSIISACQVAILERHNLQTTDWTRNSILPFLGFGVSLFLFYSIVPFILRFHGSALLNLSLLTSDMWAVIIRIFAYHEKVDWLFFVAFATVAIGLVIYSRKELYFCACGEKKAELIPVHNNELVDLGEGPRSIQLEVADKNEIKGGSHPVQMASQEGTGSIQQLQRNEIKSTVHNEVGDTEGGGS